jgi:hypothetical protein
MDLKITADEFMTKLTSSRRHWEDAVAGIPVSGWENPGFCGTWSLRDLIAHVCWYEMEMVHILRSGIFEGSPLWNLPLEERNAAVQVEMAHYSTDEIRVLEPETYREFLDLAKNMTDREINESSSFQDMPAEWIPWQVIASNTWEHYEDHPSS